MATSLGIGNHLIADFPHDVLYGYHVRRESNGNGGYIYELDPLETTPLQESAFDAYHTLIVTYHANDIIVIIPDPRPSGYPTSVDNGSAVSWASDTSFLNLISLWLANLQGGNLDKSWMPGSAVTALLAEQTGVSVNGYKPQILFKLQTKDGSTITVEWSDGVSKITSIIDSLGNSVPVRNFNGPTNFNGTYYMPDNTTYVQSLINYLNTLGAKIYLNPSQFPVQTVCVSNRCIQEN